MTPKIKHPEYMKIPYKYFPVDIRQKYNLDALLYNGYIYVEIKAGMYGLKQASVLAYYHLSESLTAAGYVPIIGSLGMWKHKSRNIVFNLCVDDFGVKFFNKDDVQHLINTLSSKYTVTCDWTGNNFLGYNIEWDYNNGIV